MFTLPKSLIPKAVCKTNDVECIEVPSVQDTVEEDHMEQVSQTNKESSTYDSDENTVHESDDDDKKSNDDSSSDVMSPKSEKNESLNVTTEIPKIVIGEVEPEDIEVDIDTVNNGVDLLKNIVEQNTVKDLREKCRIKGLGTQGKKNELAQRLIDNGYKEEEDDITCAT